MIHKFDGKGKILFFPKKWANSVTAWLSGVYSPKGTISVKNTSSPDDNGSLGLDVNIDAVTAAIVSKVEGRYLKTSDIAKIREIVRGYVDDSSIVYNGAHFGVSLEWLIEQVLKLVGNGNQQTITATKSGTTTTFFVDGVAVASIDDGEDGEDGEDGVAAEITASKSGKTTTIYADGVPIATINDGQDGTNGVGTPGSPGSPGRDGNKVTNVVSGTDDDGMPTLTFYCNDGTSFGPVSLTTRSIESISDETDDDGNVWFTVNYSDGTESDPIEMRAPSFEAYDIDGGSEIYCNGVKLCEIMDGEVTIEYADEHYAAIDHDHDETYSKIDHNHDDVYSKLDHDHDEQYADLLHDHDDDYAGKTHSHGALSSDGKISGCTSSDCFIVSSNGYLSHTELSLRVSQVAELTNKYLGNQLSLVGHTHNYAANDHTHDSRYALKNHTHSDYASQTEVSNLSAEVAGIQESLEDCVTSESLEETLSTYSNTDTLESTYAKKSAVDALETWQDEIETWKTDTDADINEISEKVDEFPNTYATQEWANGQFLLKTKVGVSGGAAAYSHTHAQYAAAGHNHDAAYATKSHTHSNYITSAQASAYATKTELGNLELSVLDLQDNCVTNESLQTTLSSYSNTETLNATYATKSEVDSLETRVDGFDTWADGIDEDIDYISENMAELGNVAASDIGTTASAGDSEYAARADHVHKLPNPSATNTTNIGGGGTDSGLGKLSSGSSTIDGSHGISFSVVGGFEYGGMTSKIYFRTITVGNDGRIVSVGDLGGGIEFDTPYE